MSAKGRICYIDMNDRVSVSSNTYTFNFNVYKAAVDASIVVLENVMVSGQNNRSVVFSVSAPNTATENVNLTGFGSIGASAPKIVVASCVKDKITITVIDP